MSGAAPFFYLKSDGTIFDGFTYALSIQTVEAPLRIDTDYPVGPYTYTGRLSGTNDAVRDFAILMTVVRA